MKLNLDYQGYVNTVVGTRINQGGNNIVCMSGCIEMQMGSQICSVVSRGAFSSCCYRLQPRKSANKFGNLYLTKCTSPSGIGETPHGSCFFRRLPKIKLNVGAVSWPQCASADSMFDADRTHTNDYKEDNSDLSYSHGKKVQTNYSIIGIPGDGRCLFRSVAHGACLRAGKSAPSESFQKKLADDLRARVADEFIKRREETEWFIEGDFDTYISQIRKPHVWGGEPELLMASHVLLMPITVYMHDEKADGLISIAEYGQEYGKENPIRVLYHGFGHYDALHIPGVRE